MKINVIPLLKCGPLLETIHKRRIDKVPFGAAFAKGLTFKMGQTHVHRYLRPLLQRIERGEIDPSFVITHRLRLEDAPAAYRTFQEKQDHCIKVVLKPNSC